MNITKHIPNAITSMNALCGTLGVIAVFEGFIEQAFFLMLAAAVFDFCDGLAARALGAYSEVGKELDSLADAISFGVLPAVMLFSISVSLTANIWVSLIPVSVAVFSVIRLAKFNVDKRQSDSFLGLATPVCALVCASLCTFICHEPASQIGLICYDCWFIPALSVILCALLISEIPMFSFKFTKDNKENKSLLFKRLAYIAEVLIIVVLVILTGHHWTLAVFISAVLYVLKNLIYAVFKI